MQATELKALLAAVAAGKVSPEAAHERLAQLPYMDLGFAKLDLHREVRSGVPEAVYAEGKRREDLEAIIDRLMEAKGRVLLTRLDPERAEGLRARHPDGRYDERSRIWTCGPALESIGATVAVLAAGTSDLPVAEEAAVCAEWLGLSVEKHYDVGVAGVHRVLDRLPAIRQAVVVIAVAGMDGALPTLVAGLVAAPVIGVPTSVGYGASFGGVAALLTMLNACAPGVAVVNIDNGYGAAVMATRMAKRRSDEQ